MDFHCVLRVVDYVEIIMSQVNGFPLRPVGTKHTHTARRGKLFIVTMKWLRWIPPPCHTGNGNHGNHGDLSNAGDQTRILSFGNILFILS